MFSNFVVYIPKSQFMLYSNAAACLMYSIIIGDTCSSLAASSGITNTLPMLATRWKVGLMHGLEATTYVLVCAWCIGPERCDGGHPRASVSPAQLLYSRLHLAPRQAVYP